jgi:hypothetical protein
VEGSCEHGNETSGSIKCWEVLEWLHNWQLLKSKFVVDAGYYVTEFMVIVGAVRLVTACCDVPEMYLLEQ